MFGQWRFYCSYQQQALCTHLRTEVQLLRGSVGGWGVNWEGSVGGSVGDSVGGSVGVLCLMNCMSEHYTSQTKAG